MNTENNESFDSERSVELKDLERKNLTTLAAPTDRQISLNPIQKKILNNTKSQIVPVELDQQEKLNILYTYYSENIKTFESLCNQQEPASSNCIQRTYYSMPILLPNTPGQLAWKSFICFLVLFYFFEIPIYIAFTEDIFNFIPFYIRKSIVGITFFFLGIDLIMEFFTAYYKHGNLITDKNMIANNYLRTYFVYDLIAYVTYCTRAALSIYGFRWIQLFFYFKYPSLLKIDYQFEEAVLLHRKLRTSYNFAKVILVLQFCFVVFSCVWFMVGNASVNAGLDSWLLNDGNFGVIYDRTPEAQLFFSYYFSVGTMTTTMGYGDITPLNMYECTCGIAGIMFAVIIFAIMVNFLFKIIEEYTIFNLRTYRQRVSINKFMVAQQVPSSLQERIRQFLNEYWYEEGGRDEAMEQDIIKLLGPELRYELTLVSFGKIFNQIPLFNQHFSKGFLKELALKVKESNVAQGDVIFHSDSQQYIDDYSIYFINNGCIQIYTNSIVLKNLYRGECFGEWSFMTGLERKAQAKAVSYTQLYRVKREDFLETLNRFIDDFETYWMIKDQLVFCEDYSFIGQCWTCGSNEHYSTECDVTHYRPNAIDILDIQTNLKNKRRRKKRKQMKWHTLSSLNLLNARSSFQNYNEQNYIHEGLGGMDRAYSFNNYFAQKNFTNQQEFQNVPNLKKQLIRQSVQLDLRGFNK